MHGEGLVPSPDGSFHLEAMDAHGGLIGSAPDLVRFLSRYRLNGTPALGKPVPDACFGALPGTFTMLMQRGDGVQSEHQARLHVEAAGAA